MATAARPIASGAEVARWAAHAAHVADEKKGTDTIVLEVGDTIGITDAFVITSGSNRRQVQMLAEEIEEQVKAAGGPSPSSIEGLQDANWVLLDYGSFVVHVFNAETRRFYDLERLWADAARLDWQAFPFTPAADEPDASDDAADGADER